MGINHTFIKHQFNIDNWIAKTSIKPFECVEIYQKPLCLAILVINNNLFYTQSLQFSETKEEIQESNFNHDKFLEIINLQQKMLAVLELPKNLLTKLKLKSEDLEQFSNLNRDPTALTKKILYIIQPRCILQFGFKNFLDVDFLQSKNISLMKTFDPFHLLLNPQDKRQAHKDLLSCKAHIAKLII